MELIDRAQIKNFAKTVYDYMGQPTQVVEVFDIYRLPIIESRPKGKWVKGDDDFVKCSFCGSYQHIDIYEEYQYYGKFCVNCGADMRGKRGSYPQCKK